MPLPKSVRRELLCENRFKYFMLMRSESKRRYGVHPINRSRTDYGEYHHLYRNIRNFPEKFFQYLRMSVESFDVLLEKVKMKIEKQHTNWKRPICSEERLVITLRYLATGYAFRSLAFAFRVGKTTVSDIVLETCMAIWDQLQDEFMPQPSTQYLQNTTDSYYKRWKFPNCFGSIDGKQCRIKCPPNAGSEYFNYLHYHSIVLQAVADADKKFITIEVGGKGKQSDGGTFIASTLFRLLESNKFNVPPSQILPGSAVVLPNVLIGDEAYPLKTYLMRPYPRRGLTPKQKHFNDRLSSARKCIECAFGILYSKWRFLAKDIETLPERASIYVKCACVLHNFVRERDGDKDTDYIEVSRMMNSDDNRPASRWGHRINNYSQAASTIRDDFTNYFWNHDK